MGRIFVAAGHVAGAGARGQGLEEGAVAVQVTGELVAELRRRGATAVHVPDELDLRPTIAWIDDRFQKGDRALELHLNAAASATAHGCLVAYSGTSQVWARRLVDALVTAGIKAWGKGVYNETEIALMRGWSHLGFPHQIPDAALLELGFITNDADVEFFRDPKKRRRLVTALAAVLAPAKPKPKLYRYTIRAPRSTVEAVKRYLRERKAGQT